MDYNSRSRKPSGLGYSVCSAYTLVGSGQPQPPLSHHSAIFTTTQAVFSTTHTEGEKC